MVSSAVLLVAAPVAAAMGARAILVADMLLQYTHSQCPRLQVRDNKLHSGVICSSAS